MTLHIGILALCVFQITAYRFRSRYRQSYKTDTYELTLICEDEKYDLMPFIQCSMSDDKVCQVQHGFSSYESQPPESLAIWFRLMAFVLHGSNQSV